MSNVAHYKALITTENFGPLSWTARQGGRQIAVTGSDCSSKLMNFETDDGSDEGSDDGFDDKSHPFRWKRIF